MKNVIVTGATGALGVHLIEELVSSDKKVYAIVRPNSNNLYRLMSFEMNENVKIIPLDMQDIEKVYSLINDEVDCIYHFAWEGARMPHRENEEMQRNNYIQSMKIYEVAKGLGVKAFIGAGSQAEYGKMNGMVDECQVCQPISEYGKYKYKVYHELTELAKLDRVLFTWGRIFSAYGRYDYPGTLVMSCIDKMRKNEPINMTKATQLWDYVYIGDVAKAFLKFGEQEHEGGVYNIATGISRPLFEFVEDIKKVLNSSSKLNFGVISYGSEGPVNLQPIVKKVEKAIGWKAETSFEAGIKCLISHETY